MAYIYIFILSFFLQECICKDLTEIKHIVLFMQENRAFDSYFGSLKGVRGFNDPMAVNLPNGDSVWKQSTDFSLLIHMKELIFLGVNSSYYQLPWHANTQTTSAM